jgi:hypothetical protein
MINYNWNFNPLTCYTHQDGYDDVVMTVHWQFIGTSGSIDGSGSQYTAQSIGTESFVFNPTGSFTPFDQLTKEIVQGWVEGKMGSDRISQMSASIAQQIEDQITPKIVNLSPPWNNPAPTGSI